jgi:hypothetical protein
MTQHEHIETIKQSVKFTSFGEATSGLTFDELLFNYTDIDVNKINATSVNLINDGMISFKHMFPEIINDYKYATVILKNEKYIVILADKTGYKLRDCHEHIQFNFKSLEQLILHITNVYQFTKKIDVDGIDYSKYSSIEYIIIDSKFKSMISSMLSIDPDKQAYDSDYILVNTSNNKQKETN